MPRRRKHWGWGYEDEQPSRDELRGAAGFLVERLGFGSTEPEPPVPLSRVSLPAPRLTPPAALAGICATDDYERVLADVSETVREVCAGGTTGALNPGVLIDP